MICETLYLIHKIEFQQIINAIRIVELHMICETLFILIYLKVVREPLK